MSLVIFINVVLASVFKRYVISMYYIYSIEETTQVKKTSIILGGIKEKELRYENSFYHVFIVVRETTML